MSEDRLDYDPGRVERLARGFVAAMRLLLELFIGLELLRAFGYLMFHRWSKAWGEVHGTVFYYGTIVGVSLGFHSIRGTVQKYLNRLKQ